MIETVTVSHEGDLFRSPTGHSFAVCSTVGCRWVGPERVSECRAQRDLELHVQEAAERGE